MSPDVLETKRLEMEKGVSSLIRELLGKRLLDIHQALCIASRYGLDGAVEHIDAQRLTYDFWAIARVLGLPLVISSGDV